MMKQFKLRTTIVLACAMAALTACGGKESYPINVNVPSTGGFDGVVYGPLVLKETFSGQTLTIQNNSKADYTFPNTIDYGDEINVVVETQPLHQKCTVASGSVSAGQRESVDVQVRCVVARYSVLGSVTVETGQTGKTEGLKLINGSDNNNAQTIGAAQTAYEFAQLPYGSAFTIGILEQPAGNTCRFVLPATQPVQTPTPAQPTPLPQITPLTASGRIPDGNVQVDVVCRAN